MKKYKIAIGLCLLPIAFVSAQEIGSDTLVTSQEVKERSIEQVVLTGYSTQRKADITGAVTVVDVNKLKQQGEPNPIKALQGKVAGMSITSDGSPSGGNTRILIRGVGTLNNTDPLYVIDGVPTKAGMHELNPNDIESIQVLKDASSASIYGSRAANGVIIITTKKGKNGRVKIDLSAYTAYSSYANRTPVLNANEFGQVLWRANINDGLDPNLNNLRYKFDWSKNNGVPVLNQIIIPEFLDAQNTLRASDTDWYREVSRTGVASSADLAVSSGSEKGNYFLSLGYYNNDGIVKHTDFRRLSARINTSFNLLDGKLKIGENFTLNQTDEVQDPGVLDPALRALPIIPVRTIDGIGWGGPVGGMNDRQNPVRLLEYNKDNGYEYTRLFGNVFADLKVLQGLTFRTSFGIDNSSYYKRFLQKKYVSGYLQNDKNAVNIDQSRTEKWTWANTLQYLFKTGRHNFDILGGTEMYSENYDNTWLRKEGFLIDDPDYMYPDAGTGTAYNGGSATSYRLRSYFAKVSYDFAQRYLVSATIRHDGSSRFGKNNRYGTFPAFSIGWRINKENFLTDNKTVSDLRLRAGWGQTGNQEISNEAVYALYLANYAGGNPTWQTPNGTAYDFAGNNSGLLPSGFIATQSKNDELKWETTTQTNVGLDFGFWNQAITGSIDLYQKKTEDILVLPPYLAIIGEGGNQWLNGAAMENKGIEVTLAYHKTFAEDVELDISGNFGANQNKIIMLPESVQNNYGGNGTTDNILGRPINSFYGYVADGLFRTAEEVDNSAQQPGKGLGRIRYADLNNDGIINDSDRTWIGNPNPGFTYGLNINFRYKSFDLSTFWQGIGDVDVINVKKYQTDFWSVDDVGSNKGKRLLNAWSPQNPDSDIPALTTVDSNAESRFSTYYVEPGDYFKLRLLQIGYTVPQTFLESNKISNLRLYISAQNILTFKSKSFTGVDPETPAYGYPVPMTFNFGLNLSL